MKKLTVLLAAVMAFAFSATAYAATPSDLADQPVKVKDAFAKTMALGIINGYEDGSAGPTQNITRAEFAKIAVTAAGAKDTADMLANNASSFKDIKPGQWYTGWINAAESLGIFQGDGNGNFRPNDTITNQEVITVLMRLLGYNDNLNGTWPVNYVTEANKKEILDDVAVVAAAPATRADVVVMLDATLDAYLVTYDKDTNEFVLKQNTKSGSTELSLLEDSFKGAYYEVSDFDNVTSIKDYAKQTLNWSVSYDGYNDNGKWVKGVDDAALIVDSETRIAANGNTLFDLDGHQGKVYFVKDSDKLYARFIDVESYTKTTTANKADITWDGAKVKVNKTSYSVKDKTEMAKLFTDDEISKDRNSNYILYFDDDDLLYDIKSDMEYDGNTVGYVKKINSSAIKMVGDVEDLSTSDDVLVYTEDGFVTLDELQVGDALMVITEDELYVKVEPTTGTLTKATSKSDGKITVAGKSYKFKGAIKNKLYDKEFETADAEIGDVYDNEVSYILNKNNTVAAVVVDEVTSSTALYGIFMGTDGSNGTGVNSKSDTVTLFTAEGKTVVFDVTSDATENIKAENLGLLFKYKLNKDGEIKSFEKMTDKADVYGKVQVVDNKVLEADDDHDGDALTLASNVVIFEIGEDDDDLDVTIVTRSSLLGGGDFRPEMIASLDSSANAYGSAFVRSNAYFAYDLNSNDDVKVLAYTTAESSNYYYGIVDGDTYLIDGEDGDIGVKFVGDETEYEIVNDMTVGNHNLVVYTKSGDDIKVVKVIKHAAGLSGYTYVVDGITDGVLKLDASYNVVDVDKSSDNKFNNTASVKNVKTNDSTVVYVIGSPNGYFELGTLEDIAGDDHIYVVSMDEDKYAKVVIVDNYNKYGTSTVADVIAKIEALTDENGNLKTDLKKADVEAARAAFDALTDAQKSVLSDYEDTLKNAEKQLNN